MCSNECSRSQFSWTHEKPVVFLISQWQKEPKLSCVYFLYRWILAVFFVAILIMNFIEPVTTESLTLIFGGIYAVSGALTITIAFNSPEREESKGRIYKTYWMFQEFVASFFFVSTLTFWSFLYDPKLYGCRILRILTHGVSVLVTTFDWFVVAHPIRLLHFVTVTITYAVAHLIMGLTSYYTTIDMDDSLTDTIFSHALKWEKPGMAALMMIGATVFSAIVHCLYWGLYKLRVWLHHKCYEKEALEETPTNA
ncbi:protein rolling stone-like [Tribolium madens]|uniref:protein rolling stone-like n=1 Tax=Tribolium madens TaxID=41895 RepID=UPI001CF73DDA|nr:protein rolling stone-like [Tribolium madens]